MHISTKLKWWIALVLSPFLANAQFNYNITGIYSDDFTNSDFAAYSESQLAGEETYTNGLFFIFTSGVYHHELDCDELVAEPDYTVSDRRRLVLPNRNISPNTTYKLSYSFLNNSTYPNQYKEFAIFLFNDADVTSAKLKRDFSRFEFSANDCGIGFQPDHYVEGISDFNEFDKLLTQVTPSFSYFGSNSSVDFKSSEMLLENGVYGEYGATFTTPTSSTGWQHMVIVSYAVPFTYSALIGNIKLNQDNVNIATSSNLPSLIEGNTVCLGGGCVSGVSGNILITSTQNITIKHCTETIFGSEFIAELGSELSVDENTNCNSGVPARFATQNSVDAFTEVSGSDVVSVSPNPSQGLVELRVKSSNAQLTMFNSRGQEVYADAIDSEVSQHDFTSLPAGIYILSIVENDKMSSTKIVIE